MAKKTKKIAAGKLPSKTSINLAKVGIKHMNVGGAILGILLIVIAAGAFSKFGVVDRFARLAREQERVTGLKNTVEDLEERIASYGELTDEYAHYTYSGFHSEELLLQDRIDVLKLLETYVFPKTDVTHLSIAENQVSLSLIGKSLQDVNMIAAKMEEEEIVDFCEIQTATTEIYDEGEGVQISMIIYLNPRRGE